MNELPSEYLNELAKQIVFLSALLGGFSLAVIVSLLGLESASRIGRRMFRASIVSAASFLISLFAMTKILMITTEGYPSSITATSIAIPRMMGGLAFISGLVSLFVMIGFAGWIKSKQMGRFTTVIAIVSFVCMLILMVEVS